MHAVRTGMIALLSVAFLSRVRAEEFAVGGIDRHAGGSGCDLGGTGFHAE